MDKGISDAKAKAADKNYDEAVKILDSLLAFDKDNKEASHLKKQYNDSIQSIKDAESKKQAEIATQNAAQTAASKTVATAAKTSTTTNTVGAYPKAINLNGGVHIIENKQQDDGHFGGTIVSCRFMNFGSGPMGIYFQVVAFGDNYDSSSRSRC